VTDDSAFKKQVRARMAKTGENFTTARRMVIAGRDPGQPPAALRVYLNPHVDLTLTDEMARAYAAADEQGQRDIANRLLADHIDMAGAGDAGVAAGSQIMTVQALRIEEIGAVVRRRIGQAAGVSTVAVSGDMDQVRVEIEAARPGVVSGHGGAEADRLRAELEELTGKPVMLSIGERGWQERPKEGSADDVIWGCVGQVGDQASARYHPPGGMPGRLGWLTLGLASCARSREVG
jgi:hypothetical protein